MQPAVIALLISLSAQAADCPEPLAPALLERRLEIARAAFQALDVEGFTAAMDDVVVQIPCLDAPPSAQLVARLHQLQGVRQFAARDEARAVQAFAAARAVDPDGRLRMDLVPDGHVLIDLYGRLPLENGGTEPMPLPRAGELWLDGAPADLRPTAWPTLWQRLDAEGQVQDTAYLYPRDALPTYDALPMSTVDPGLHPVERGLWIGAAGGALLAGASYAAAAVSAARFASPPSDWDRQDLEAAQGRTNALVGLSLGLGAASVGAGSVALVGSW